MDGIRLQNIRSLADTGTIHLRPITLLLGQNSSGKSTVLRSLPLISQSLKTRSNAPVLWFGDAVDFGSLDEVRSTFAQSETVKIELDMGRVAVRPRTYYPGANRYILPLKIQIELDEVDGRTKLRSFTITCEEDTLNIVIDNKGNAAKTLVNQKEYDKILPADRFRFLTSDIIPQIVITRNAAEDSRSGYYDPYRRSVDTADRELRRILSTKLHGRISEDTITALARKIRFKPKSEFLADLSEVSSPLKTWKTFVQELGLPQGAEMEADLRNLAFLAYLSDILGSLDRELRSVAVNISYVGPSRATGERYYRIQELAVDQIDPQGKNLAMFLDSLSPAQLRNFSDWLVKSIGYALKIGRSTGHIQIELRERNSEKYYNIADMGYGFSQVLPIMAQIWGKPSSRRPANETSRIFAMEQPELHLHPAYQARLADILSGAVSNESTGSNNVRFLIETHSEALINRLGELVYEGKVSVDDVAIYVFERGIDDEVTRIRSVSFEKDGTLSNWPIGFFSAASGQ